MLDNDKNFFKQDTEALAQSLLGKLLLFNSDKGLTGGFIAECEAYLGIPDTACHSFGGNRTPKVEAMYQEAGTIYIYTIHTRKMLNIVTCPEGNPQAVLVRALEPAAGISIMEENRNKSGILLTNGPGKLTEALGINRLLNMTKMQTGRLYIDFSGSIKPKTILTSPRIGIPNKGEWTNKPLRFFVKGCKYVSGMRKKDVLEEPWEAFQ